MKLWCYADSFSHTLGCGYFCSPIHPNELVCLPLAKPLCSLMVLAVGASITALHEHVLVVCVICCCSSWASSCLWSPLGSSTLCEPLIFSIFAHLGVQAFFAHEREHFCLSCVWDVVARPRCEHSLLALGSKHSFLDPRSEHYLLTFWFQQFCSSWGPSTCLLWCFENITRFIFNFSNFK